MRHPDLKESIKILKDLEEREKRGEIIGTLIIADNASLSDKTKYRICKKISNLKKTYELTNVQVARLLGVHKSVVSKVVNRRIYEFTIDRLLDYYDRLIDSTESKKMRKALDREIKTFLDTVG